MADMTAQTNERRDRPGWAMKREDAAYFGS
jgi:hypothetical protein